MVQFSLAAVFVQLLLLLHQINRVDYKYPPRRVFISKIIMKLKLILLVLYIDIIQGIINENSTYWTGKVQFCGPRLAGELAIICKGIYNEVRDINHHIHQSNFDSKQKRGVADDCCLSTCTRRYMKTYYCGPEPPLYVSSAQQLREMAYVNYTYYYQDLFWIALQTPPPDE